MKVIVASKNEFDSFMKKKGITNDNVEDTKPFYISINNTEKVEGEEPYFKEAKNVMVLWFDDVEEDVLDSNGHLARAFTISQARELLLFIQQNAHRGRLIVHCSAGISRSGAVGQFVSDYFGGDKDEFKQTNPHILPNGKVLRTLKAVYEGRL